jgi:hypothetical protein
MGGLEADSRWSTLVAHLLPQRKRAGGKAPAAVAQTVKFVFKLAENLEEKARKNTFAPLGPSQALVG